MTKQEAEEYVRGCAEDEGPESESELRELFHALYDRYPDAEDADVWSLCCAAVADTYTISYANGEPDQQFDTYEEAKGAICGRWPEAEIGHDGDLEGFGDRTLFWACDADSVDDDGARALGAIRRTT